eukprot:203885_1
MTSCHCCLSLVLFLLINLHAILSSASVTFDNWINSTTYLPRASRGMAVGYDNVNDKIWFLGGYPTSNQKQAISFKNNIFSDLGTTAMPQRIYGEAQYYTQINNILWIIDGFSGTQLTRFNLETQQIDYNFHSIIIPTAVTSG